MKGVTLERAVLLADVTGSTPLYEALGDAEAALRVARCTEVMRDAVERERGVVVKEKGDDLLALFETADAALAAVEAILRAMPIDGLTVHAGLSFGEVVGLRGDVFGDAVNLAARLAALANPGELLASATLARRLSPARASGLRPLDVLRVKGKADPVELFGLSHAPGLATSVTRWIGDPGEAAGIMVRLRHGGTERLACEGSEITLGRAAENHLMISRPWISRRHARIVVQDGRAQLVDFSSQGTFLRFEGAAEIAVRRETIFLTGAGSLSLGAPSGRSGAVRVDFEVL